MLALLKSQSPYHLPLINFPFLFLNLWLTLSPHLPYNVMMSYGLPLTKFSKFFNLPKSGYLTFLSSEFPLLHSCFQLGKIFHTKTCHRPLTSLVEGMTLDSFPLQARWNNKCKIYIRDICKLTGILIHTHTHTHTKHQYKPRIPTSKNVWINTCVN